MFFIYAYDVFYALGYWCYVRFYEGCQIGEKAVFACFFVVSIKVFDWRWGYIFMMGN